MSKNGCPYGYKRGLIKNGNKITYRHYTTFCVVDKNFDYNNIDPTMYRTKNNGETGDKLEFCPTMGSYLIKYREDSVCRETDINANLVKKMCADTCSFVNNYFDKLYEKEDFEKNNVVDLVYKQRIKDADRTLSAWGPEKAFDNKPSTTWLFKPVANAPFDSKFHIAWIHVKHSIKSLLKKYTIQIGSREGWSLERAPKKWILIARKPSQPWKIIDERDGITWSQEGEIKEFVVNTNEKFDRYRLIVKENSSTSAETKNQLEIAEIDYISEK